MARLPYPFNPARFAVADDGCVIDCRREFVDQMVRTIESQMSALVKDATRPCYATTHHYPIKGDRPKNGSQTAPQLRSVLIPSVSKPDMDEAVLEIYTKLAADRLKDVFLHRGLYGKPGPFTNLYGSHS